MYGFLKIYETFSKTNSSLQLVQNVLPSDFLHQKINGKGIPHNILLRIRTNKNSVRSWIFRKKMDARPSEKNTVLSIDYIIYFTIILFCFFPFEHPMAGADVAH